jgi:hypothetical protein
VIKQIIIKYIILFLIRQIIRHNFKKTMTTKKKREHVSFCHSLSCVTGWLQVATVYV